MIAAGEILTGAGVCAVYLLLGKFALPVLLGAVLGAILATGNFIFLSITVNRATDRAIAERGSGELSEEESEAFAAEHRGRIAAAVRLSFAIRMAVMVAALVLGFLSGLFDPIATLITILPWRLLLSASGMIGKKSA